MRHKHKQSKRPNGRQTERKWEGNGPIKQQEAPYFRPSEDPSARKFVRLDDVLHVRLPFSTVKTPYSLSTVFDGNHYDQMDQLRVFVEFEASGDKAKSCGKTIDALKQIL